MPTVGRGLQQHHVATEAEEDRPAWRRRPERMSHAWHPTGCSVHAGRRNRERRPEGSDHTELDLPVKIGAQAGHRLVKAGIDARPPRPAIRAAGLHPDSETAAAADLDQDACAPNWSQHRIASPQHQHPKSPNTR